MKELAELEQLAGNEYFLDKSFSLPIIVPPQKSEQANSVSIVVLNHAITSMNQESRRD